jgi:hypothetical protein
MDESASGCWTNHQSVIQFKNQWYLFYHNNDLSPQFDKNRSVRIDSLFFNIDGTIKKVIPTLRGVGLTSATKEIQIDRYSKISDKGVSIDFIDTTDKFKGWKTIFNETGAWVQYNSVDFGKKFLKTLSAKALSETGGIIQVRTKSINGPILAEINIAKSNGWKINRAKVAKFEEGLQNLFMVSKDGKSVELDWISFE